MLNLVLGIVCLVISVLLYNLYDQLVVSDFENVFFKSAALTRLLT